MSFIFLILENEVLILKMNLDDFLILQKSFSRIRKRVPVNWETEKNEKKRKETERKKTKRKQGEK